MLQLFQRRHQNTLVLIPCKHRIPFDCVNNHDFINLKRPRLQPVKFDLRNSEGYDAPKVPCEHSRLIMEFGEWRLHTNAVDEMYDPCPAECWIAVRTVAYSSRIRLPMFRCMTVRPYWQTQCVRCFYYWINERTFVELASTLPRSSSRRSTSIFGGCGVSHVAIPLAYLG